ncbi:MAG: cation-transporting P-type ATPase, partial [Actinomycetota bacterium]
METIQDNSIPFHVLTIDECLRALDTSRHGLVTPEAIRRLAAIGPNELEEPERTSPWVLLAAQFRNVLIVILLIAVALSAALGHGIEAIIIGVIVVFAALLGFVQEYRAERAIEALREMAAPTARV